MKNLLLCLLGCLPVLVWGQLWEENTILDCEYCQPTDVIIQDLDGDNLPDLIVSFYQNLSPSKLSWFKNNGGGTFGPENIISTQGTDLSSIAVADLDGDNDVDIVTISDRDSEVSWFENYNDGEFSEKKTISNQISSGRDLDIADFNGDGYVDLISASSVDGKIAWYQNNGDGNFSEQIIISNMASFVYSIALGDLNNDSNIDLVSTAISGSRDVAWYMNRGSGNFDEKEIIFNTDFLAPLVSVGNINDDNKLDIVYATANGGTQGNELYWQENNNSTFSSQNLIEERITEYIDVEVEDLDNDGDLDIVASMLSTFANEHTIIWYENDGDGNFIIHSLSSNIKMSDGQLSIADIDNDGYKDVACASKSMTGKIVWFKNLLRESSTLEGKIYYDSNANNIFDPLERTLSNIGISISPINLSIFTDSNGNYKFYLSEGMYETTPVINDCWQLTTDSSSYTVTIDSNTATEFNFGFQLASDYQHTQARINSNPTRCGFEVPFTLSVENDGCVPSQGQYGIVLDDLVTLISTEIEPNEVRGDTLLWNYAELIASQNDRVHLTLEIAGADFIGDTIQLTGLSYIENEQGALELSNSYDYTSEIRCAYDPNDKLVYPNRAGEYDANYTLFEEQLEYTVRFQNTGNDTAFTVIIRDELDINLDWTTFKPVLASHPHETLLHGDGLVEFTFRDILLPDSTINEPLSHGFVTYRILPKADSEESTTIKNTANIFFDFNPPIETNTTQNVLVSELPKMTSTREISRQEKVQVYPNPFEDLLSFQMESKGDYQLRIFDALGNIIGNTEIKNKVYNFSTKHFANGIYFYQITTFDGQLLASGKLIKAKS